MELREWLANSSAAPPTRPVAPSTGYAQGGVTPTKPGAFWYHQISEELRALQVAGGQGPDATKLTQVLLAIQTLMQAGAPSYAVATGTANAHVVALIPALTARVDGMVIRYKAPAANTGALTLNDGVDVVAVVGAAHAALQGGETTANGDVWVQWNSSIGGGCYVMIDSTGGAMQVASGAQPGHAPNLGQFLGLLSANGYIKIPVVVAGALRTLIIQAGSVSGGSGVVFTFPIAFPSATMGIVATITNAAAYAVGISASSLTNCTFVHGAGPTGIYVIAIGY